MLRYLVALAAVSPLLGQRIAEAVEPNQTAATATPLPCVAEGAGQLVSAVDVDWWRITLASPSEMLFETMPGPGVQIGDTILTLLDATGAPLRSNDNGVGSGLYSRLHVPELAAGTYYVAVERGAAGATAGSYELDVRCMPAGAVAAPPIVNEGPENNDPRVGGTPTTIVPDTRCNGTLATTGSGGDWDFWRFTLTEPSFVRASVDATPSHPNPPVADDLVLYLFDGGSPPTMLASSFAGTTFGAWNVEIAMWLAPGTYQIAVRGWRGSIAGKYWLDVRRTLGASTATNANGCAGRTLDVLRTNSGPNAPLGLERPVIGRTYVLQGTGLGASLIGIHLFGIVPASVDLGPFGAPGCTLGLAWIDLLAFVTDGAGAATIALTLGEDPSLLGLPLETQVLMLDGGNPLGMTLSNSVSAVMGN